MKEKAKITFADLKRIRADLGVTQKELAKMLDVSYACIQKWEAGWPKIPKIIESLLSNITKKVSTKKVSTKKTILKK